MSGRQHVFTADQTACAALSFTAWRKWKFDTQRDHRPERKRRCGSLQHTVIRGENLSPQEKRRSRIPAPVAPPQVAVVAPRQTRISFVASGVNLTGPAWRIRQNERLAGLRVLANAALLRLIGSSAALYQFCRFDHQIIAEKILIDPRGKRAILVARRLGLCRLSARILD